MSDGKGLNNASFTSAPCTPLRSECGSSMYVPTPCMLPSLQLTPNEPVIRVEQPGSPRGDEYFSQLNSRPVPLRYTPHKGALAPIEYVDELGFELHSSIERNDFCRFAEHLTQGLSSHRCWRERAQDEWCSVLSQCDVPLDLQSPFQYSISINDDNDELTNNGPNDEPQAVLAEEDEEYGLPALPRSNALQASLSLPSSVAVGDVLSFGLPVSIRPLLWYTYSGAPLLRAAVNTHSLQMDVALFSYLQLLTLPTLENDQLVVSVNSTLKGLACGDTLQCLKDTVSIEEAQNIDLYATHPHLLHTPSKVRKMLADINKDQKRTLCAHPQTRSQLGQDAIKRILTAFVYKYPHIGYIQSLNFVAALVLIVFGVEHEEEAFWTFCGLVGNIMEKNYSGKMEHLLHLSEGFQEWLLHTDKSTFALQHEQGVDLSFRAVSWFLCLFFTYVPAPIAVYLLDVALYMGAAQCPDSKTMVYANARTNEGPDVRISIPVHSSPSVQYSFIISTWFHAMRALVRSAEAAVEKLTSNAEANQFEQLQTLGSYVAEPSQFAARMALPEEGLVQSLMHAAKDLPAILQAGELKRDQTASRALLEALAQHQELSVEQAMQERVFYKARKPSAALTFGGTVNTVSRKKSLFLSPVLSPRRLRSPTGQMSPRKIILSPIALLSPKSPIGRIGRQSNYFFPHMMRSPDILSPILRRACLQNDVAVELHPERLMSHLELTHDKDQTLLQNASLLSQSYRYDDLNVSYSLLDTPGRKKKKKNTLTSQSSRPNTCEKNTKGKKAKTIPQKDEQWMQYLDVQNQTTNDPHNISKTSINSIELLDMTQFSQLNLSTDTN